MTGAEIAQIVVALATLVTACGSVIIGVRNSRKIEEVHKATNSLADRAIVASRAEGNLVGRAEQTAERQLEKEGR